MPPYLRGAAVDVVDRAVQIFRRHLETVVEGAQFSLQKACSPQDARAAPLWILNPEMKRRPGDRDTRVDKLLAHIDEDVVDESLLARLRHQPIENRSPPRWPEAFVLSWQIGNLFGQALHGGLSIFVVVGAERWFL